MAQTLFLANRVHNVMGNFNRAMSNWIQRGNPDRFKHVDFGPKNSRGYFIKHVNENDIAENIPLPFLNSNSKIEEVDSKYGLEMWRNPRITPDWMTSKTMDVIFYNDWVKLGVISQRIIGTTEFIAQFDSYMSALDFQLEMIAMFNLGKTVQPDEFRYYIEIPDNLVYYTEKGEQTLDLLSDEVVKYENVYSINQKKFLKCSKLTPQMVPEFPQPPEARLDADSADSYTVTFNVKFEIELPMWLVLETHHRVDSFKVSLAFDYESGGGMPKEDFTQYFPSIGASHKYQYEEMTQLNITETGFHNIVIETNSFPEWNDHDTVRVFINDVEVSDFILADDEITFGRYIEKNSIIWVARYSRNEVVDIDLLADIEGEYLQSNDTNDVIGS